MNDEEFNAQLGRIETDLAAMREDIQFIRDTIVKADTTITKVSSDVMPMVLELSNSPMLKMLGVGKKK